MVGHEDLKGLFQHKQLHDSTKGVIIVFFQSSGTSPDHHDLLKIDMSGLTMTLASSLSTFGSIPSDPLEFYVFSLFKYSQTCSSSTDGKFSLLQTTTLVSGAVIPEGKS